MGAKNGLGCPNTRTATIHATVTASVAWTTVQALASIRRSADAPAFRPHRNTLPTTHPRPSRTRPGRKGTEVNGARPG
ncbi:hypothetical protein GCM10010439_04950 [Actinocorallia aurantiaca]|uniref:Uncharacterized protein n=1 Tax=Actinocorallia aurantiaca TaxID=46204 RepID=A0ABN3TVK4_9ACTN